MSKDNFGDRMKSYESQFTIQKLDHMKPVIARLDGRSFSTLTRNLEKPFDFGFKCLMEVVCSSLVKETNAVIGYQQSDEITLVWKPSENIENNKLFFDGKMFKMVSVLASIASSHFNYGRPKDKMGYFDCRVWNVPTKSEAANTILWRVMDSERNAIQSIAQNNFSNKELYCKSKSDQIDMLNSIGIKIEDYNIENIIGTFYKRKIYKRYDNVYRSSVGSVKEFEDKLIKDFVKWSHQDQINFIFHRDSLPFEGLEK